MTPKEKAEELVIKFLSHAAYKYDPDTDIELRDFHARKCALICVDELIKLSNEWIIFIKQHVPSVKIEDDKYWAEVKQEIEKL